MRWHKPLKGHNLIGAFAREKEGVPLRLSWLLIAAIVALAAVSVQARARVQAHMLCLDPDMEFPVACDDDDG